MNVWEVFGHFYPSLCFNIQTDIRTSVSKPLTCYSSVSPPRSPILSSIDHLDSSTPTNWYWSNTNISATIIQEGVNHLCVCVCVCVYVPDCCSAEGGRGAGGNVGVVLGVELIIDSILQGDKRQNSINLSLKHTHTHTHTHLRYSFSIALSLLATMCGSIAAVHWRIGCAQISG